MKLKLLSELLMLLLIGTGLEGCGHVTVYDTEWCGDLGAIGAHCAHTLTDKKRDMDKAHWDQERIGYLCANSTGFNDTETAIDQLCVTTGLCDYKTREAITKAMNRIRPVARRALKARRAIHLDESPDEINDFSVQNQGVDDGLLRSEREGIPDSAQ